MFSRSELLYGAEAMQKLMHARVIVIGVGGVGSWCAEALVRTGIGAITLVDADMVDVSNINRQAPATTDTVGRPKAEVMAERMRAINPACHVEAIHKFYAEDNAAEFGLETYDVIIDAIDSLASKAALIMHATSLPDVGFFSSMGAARRFDPGLVANAEFWKVKGCPLARALRDRFKKESRFPHRKFQCVYSPEALHGEPKGTSMPVTAAFGLRLAYLSIGKITGQY